MNLKIMKNLLITTCLSCTLVASALEAISTPIPADLNGGMGTGIELQWQAVTGATAYDLYLGTTEAAVTAATTASPEYQGEVTTNTSQALTLALQEGTTYYWRVDAKDATTTTAGSVYSFSTATVKTLPTLQSDFMGLEYGMFLHYNMGTYTGEEWATWNKPDFATVFNPGSTLDCYQWAQTAFDAEMKYMVLTTKHHDGFALWDSEYSTYDIAETDWGKSVNGKDIVKEYTDACRAKGLKVGLYYSIWDRTFEARENSGRDAEAYKVFIKGQLKELLTRYGQIDYLWFDGWGWPGNADAVGYHRVPYEEIREFIRALQPNCLVLDNNHEGNNDHTDIVGWEYNIIGMPEEGNTLNAEMCGNIYQRNWFYHEGEALRSIYDLKWFRVNLAARHCNYLLDLTPNLQGLIPDEQVQLVKDMVTYELPTFEIDDNMNSVVYTGSWTEYANAAHFNGECHISNTVNDSFEIHFSGTGIELVNQTNSDHGLIDIYIDGVLHTADVSQKSAERTNLQTIFSVTGLENKSHVLKGVVKTAEWALVDAVEVIDYNTDAGAPTISGLNVTNLTASTFDFDLNCDEYATIYWMLKNAGEGVPQESEIVAGLGAVVSGNFRPGVTGALPTESVTGITPGSDLVLYVIAKDYADNGSNIMQAPVQTPSGLATPFALDLDGSDDRLQIAAHNNLKLNQNNFSIAAWIHPDTFKVDDGSASGNTEYRNDIISHGQNGSAWDSWTLMLKEGKIAFRTRKSGSASDFEIVTSTANVTVNEWTHVAATFDLTAGEMSLYVNGILDATVAVTGTPFDNSAITQIGGDTGPRYQFDGQIDELSIWNKTLTATEITAIRNETFVQDGLNLNGNITEAQIEALLWADLIAYFPFDEGAGTTTTDKSANAFSASINGGATWVASKHDWKPVLTPVLGLESDILDGVLYWQVEQEVDVASYQIFVDGILFTTVIADASPNYSVSLPAGYGEVIIRVIDHSGFVQSFPVGSNQTLITLQYQPGWNMISLPFNQTFSNTELWLWNPAAQTYELSNHLEPLQGAWIWAEKADNAHFSGIAELNQLDLMADWNLVGVAENCQIDDPALTIYSWDQVYEATQVLTPGQAYWIYAPEATRLQPE